MALIAHSFAASPYVLTDKQFAANPNVAANLGARSSEFNGFGSQPLNFGFPIYNYPTGQSASLPAAASGIGFGVPSDDDFTIGIRQALAQAGFTGSEFPSPLASFNPITGYPVATTIPQYQPIPQPQSGPAAASSSTEINPTGIDYRALHFIAAPPTPKIIPADKDSRQQSAATQTVKTNAPSQSGRNLNGNHAQSLYPVKDEKKIRLLQETAATASTAYPKPNDITTTSTPSFTPTQRPSISDLILELKPPASSSNAQSFEYYGNQNPFSSPSSSSASSQASYNHNSNTAITTSTTTNPLPGDSYSVSGSTYRAVDPISGGANSAQSPLRTPSYSSVPSISYTLSSGTPDNNAQNLVPDSGAFNNHAYRGSDTAQPTAAQYSSQTPVSKSPPNTNNNYYHNVPNPIPNNVPYNDAYRSTAVAPNVISNFALFNNQVYRGSGSGQPIVVYSSSVPVPGSVLYSNNNNYYNNVPNSSNQYPGTNLPVSSNSFAIPNPHRSLNSIQSGAYNTPGNSYNSPK